jgi:hypothetical protein
LMSLLPILMSLAQDGTRLETNDMV